MLNTEYIRKMLLSSKEPHLADAFDMLPLEMMKAIDLMVTNLRAEEKQPGLIRLYVIHDVAAGLEGKHHASLHAFRFLKPETIGTL